MPAMSDRRAFLGVATAAALLAACRGAASPSAAKDDGDEVGAVEDLMREHGVIRRVLVVYRESAVRLRTDPRGVDAGALQRAARLVRTFGEDYHERQLEEAYIFPAVAKTNREAIDAL